ARARDRGRPAVRSERRRPAAGRSKVAGFQRNLDAVGGPHRSDDRRLSNLTQSLSSDALIRPRISPPGDSVVCTLAYATPARIAAITSASVERPTVSRAGGQPADRCVMPVAQARTQREGQRPAELLLPA